MDRFKDILATLGNAAALIVVIQNAIGTGLGYL